MIWDVDQGGSSLEALILNGELMLLEGDLIDWNGDGVIDAMDEDGFIDNFTGITSLTLSNRDINGNVTMGFTADVNINAGTILEGGFLMSVNVIPEPGFGSGVVILGLLLVRRRRS